jgi:hypothetical protein
VAGDIDVALAHVETIDLAHFRIYQCGCAGLSTTYQMRPAPTRRDLFEYHGFTALLNV